MSKLQYVVRIEKQKNSDWGASVPDLPGCIAVAKTLDAVVRRIRIAMAMHLEGMREDGIRPPRPRPRVVRVGKTASEMVVYASVEVAG